MNSIANIIAAFFLSSLFVSVLIAGDSYYWSDGRKIKLIEDRSSLVLIYKEGSTYKNTEATHSRKKDVKSVTVSTDQKVTVVQLAAPKSSAILEVVKDFEIDERDLDWYSFGYRLETGASMRPTNRISFLLKTKYSLQDLERIVRNRATYDRTPYGTLMLRVIGPQVSVIDLANEVYESGIVEYCHPDFIAELVRYTDPLYPEQYYLNNTGQFGGTVNIDIDAPEAWDITLSSSQIKVAVIDEGGESHEDLNDQNGVSRVLTGYTPSNNGNGGPYGTGAGHGVACAGIIAASHNQLHVRGVAPNVKMLFVNIFWPGTTDQNIADGIGWAWRNGADVLSNSWGYGPGTYVDAVKKSIDSARTYGRNGKGSVVVFAAGNEGGAVAFPANVAGVIAVGAIDRSGNLWNYSARGSRLDVVAPSGNVNLQGDVRTLDRMGSNGYNSGNSMTNFGGTSAACPQVAGVAALMLSVDASLTEEQVSERIKSTATDMGVQGRDDTFGHGRINAYRAVKEAMPKLINYTFTSNMTLGYTRLFETATIASNVTVTVEAGRTVLMEGLLRGGSNSQLRVYGTLILETAAYVADVNIVVENGGRLVTRGTPSGRISLTSLLGTWQGITFNGAGPSTLSYCDILYATMPIKATNTSNLTISNVTIGNSSFYNGSDNAAMAFYNSSPTVSSVTINGQSNSWNGVRFAQGSTGSITNSTIQNCGAGNGIVVQGNSSPTISNNTIRNNYYHGIIVVSNGTGNPIITGNAVESNGIVNGNKIYNGINFYYSAGKVVENTVRYNNFGVYCDSYSSPSSSHGGQGRNLITANRFGILVHYNSNPTFGVFNSSTNQYVGACNKILANDVVNAKAQYSSTLWAQGTWWGADPPDASQIVAVENSLIEYSYWRPFDDNDCISGPQPKIVGTTASPPEDFPTLLRTALLARLRGDYAAAGAAYRAVLSGSAKIEERRRALVGLFELFRDSKDHSLVNIIAQYRNTTGELGLVASELSAASLMAMGDYNPAKQILASLRSRYPKTEVEQRALVLLASLNGYTLAEQSSANSALLELLEKFEAAIDRGLLVALGGVVLQEGSNRLAAHESSPASLAVVNYPNPFNPSTVIQFTLPDAGHVSLKVFDLLGREVATLLNEHRTAGTHQVHFDARALPSGLYFYRLDAAGTLAIQKMLLAR